MVQPGAAAADRLAASLSNMVSYPCGMVRMMESTLAAWRLDDLLPGGVGLLL